MGSSFPSEDFAVLQRACGGGGPRLQGLPEKFAMTLLWAFLLIIAHKSRMCVSGEHVSVTIPALVFNSQTSQFQLLNISVSVSRGRCHTGGIFWSCCAFHRTFKKGSF